MWFLIMLGIRILIEQRGQKTNGHQIEPNSLENWNIGNEELIAIVSLVSLESKEVKGSGNSQIFLYQNQKNERNYTTSFLLIFRNSSILVIQSEKRRQQNMPLIRPLIIKKNSDRDYDYFIEITTRRALVKEIMIDGNGYWRCSPNKIPKEIPSQTTEKIKIRQISKQEKMSLAQYD